MKPNNSTILFSLLALFLFSSPLYAQDDQIERDIRIAEGILSEIFGGNKTGFPFAPHSHTRVRGEYIPGYGIHFTIAGHPARPIGRFVMRGQQASDTEKNDKDVSASQESIKEKMTEYLLNYAGVIRGLDDDDHIRLTYGSDGRAAEVALFASGSVQLPRDAPKISAWTSFAALRNHQSGNLSDSQLQNLITFYDLGDSSPKSDLNIFASVLQTALQDTGLEHLQISRKPSVEYLPELGAHFSLRITSGPRFLFGTFGRSDYSVNLDSLMAGLPKNIRIEMPRIELSLDSLRVQLSEMDDSLKDLGEFRFMSDSLRAQQPRLMALQPASPSDTTDYSEDAGLIIDTLREIIRDYGPTLSSLSGDERLMITIQWPARSRDLPERTHLRITKSGLLAGLEPEIHDLNR
jgi:hypothetical protein